MRRFQGYIKKKNSFTCVKGGILNGHVVPILSLLYIHLLTWNTLHIKFRVEPNVADRRSEVLKMQERETAKNSRRCKKSQKKLTVKADQNKNTAVQF